jgi:UDP-N-acetylglucosamine--N-acetylmuramyl-(pentapeptide) pyrophosphoryl-undecaprenol N-acetylglucosamine transferase
MKSAGKETEYRLVIAGGGTGGHLFPGLATAREWMRRHPDARVLFVTGDRPMEARILEKSGYKRVSIRIRSLKGRGWKGGLATLTGLPGAFFQSRATLKRFSPRVVLGVGGYSSGPVCVAARTLDVPTAVHEQNSIPGLTNRLLSRIVDRVFISFEESAERFAGGRRVYTGNPVREELLGSGPGVKGPGEPLDLLAVGGSQGARAVNTALAYALLILKRRGRVVRVVHQTGEQDFERVLGIYTDKGIQGVVTPFIDDMARAYHDADLVLGRAGASTVTELAALGKASILVPYPYAADDHQTANARALADSGGAVLLRQKDLTASRLADLLEKYDQDREALARMASRAGEKGRPGAARAIVTQLEDMMGVGRGAPAEGTEGI